MVDLNSKVYPQINEFGGINTGAAPFNIADNESTDERNLGSDNYPSISQRKAEEELDGNEEFESIIYAGYLAGGELFCIGKKKGDTRNDIYKFDPEADEEMWSRAITETKLYNDEFRPTSKVDISDEDEIETVIRNTATSIFLGRSWDASVGAGLIIGYNITRRERKNDKGETYYDYVCAEIGFPYDGFNTEEFIGKTTFAKIKDDRYLLASRHNTYLSISMYQELNYKAVDDTAIYNIITEAGNDATGLALFGDTVLYFKRNSTHILYGKTPDSYYLDVLSRAVGCISHRSIAEAGGALFWLSDDGIYAYSATTRPYKVSQRVQKYIDNMEDGESACAASDGRKYYISLKQKSGEHIMLMYDTEKNIWHVWDSRPYTQLIYKSGEMTGLAGNKIYKLFKKPFEGKWHYTSKPFDIGGISRSSNIYRLFLNVYGKKGAEVEVSISGEADGNNFKTILRKKYGSDKREKLDIKIAPCKEVRNLKHFRFKIAGSGECEVYGVDVYMRVLGRSY